MTDDTPVRLVAITGGSGAGKTWLADRLHRLLGKNAARLSQDCFYRDWSHLPPAERAQLNFDHPDMLDWDHFGDVLRDLRQGRPCQLPAYDYCTHRREPAGEILQPRPVVIVDGLWLLHRPEIRRHFELSVFLHCPAEERLRRRMARDTVERDRTEASVLEQFHGTVAPMHQQFVSPQAAHADLLLHHPSREAEILQLQERLSRLVPLAAGMGERLLAFFRPQPTSLAPMAGTLTALT
ncbi:MAG TPA: uridine kinase [Lacunisphaera sp.]|nr:uridine kinase [Lacunisphaera sp.]